MVAIGEAALGVAGWFRFLGFDAQLGIGNPLPPAVATLRLISNWVSNLKEPETNPDPQSRFLNGLKKNGETQRPPR